MSQNFSPSRDSSVGRNLSLFNADVIKSISDTVRFTLMKNASFWVKKGYIDLDDFIQSANLHILNRSSFYDPDHGTPFKAWVSVVARNYTISESKKLKKIISAKTYKIRSITTQAHGQKSSSFFGASPPKNAKNLIKIARARPSAASVFGALPPRRGQEGQKGARRPSVSEHMHPLL